MSGKIFRESLASQIGTFRVVVFFALSAGSVIDDSLDCRGVCIFMLQPANDLLPFEVR